MAEGHRHVLVVEDAAELRTLFEAILTDAGYRVTLLAAAPPVSEAARLRPDAVVLDLLLDDDDEAAWGLIVAMREHDALRPVPVIACSAATALVRHLRDQFEGMGVAFVAKPFELDDFLAAVARAVDRSPG